MAKVKCPYCGKEFDRDKLKEGVDWIQNLTPGLGKNRFFHVNCLKAAESTPKTEWPDYINRAHKAGGELQMWAEMCYDYMMRDLKIHADFLKIKSQLENFKKKHMNYEGMYKTLRYCYEIKHLISDRAEGGIGIVPFQYDEAYEYFSKQRDKQNEFINMIDKQIEDRKRASNIILKHRAPTRQKNKIDFSKIDEVD